MNIMNEYNNHKNEKFNFLPSDDSCYFVIFTAEKKKLKSR